MSEEQIEKMLLGTADEYQEELIMEVNNVETM